MKVTKDLIIEAIYSEPLYPETFVSSDDDKDIGCTVCAVGATLRHLGFKNSAIENTAYALIKTDNPSNNGQLSNALKNKDWLGALSIKYEKLSLTNGQDEVVEKLVRWVEKNLPNSFRI